MGEIIHIHIGQCGVQLGSAFWEQFALEHGIEPDGALSTTPPFKKDENRLDKLFYETKEGKYIARSLFADADSFVIDSVKRGANRELFSPNNIFYEKDESLGLSRSSHRYHGTFDELFLDRLRQLSEGCDNPQGYIVTHSICGGFGSGYVSRLLYKMSVDYPKKPRVSYSMFPSPSISNLVIEPYNMILGMMSLIDHVDLSILFDNEALYRICSSQMDKESPNYANINQIVAQALSTSFSSVRFGSSINSNINEMITNLVPYPRMHFVMLSYAPFGSRQRNKHVESSFSIEDIANTAFNQESVMLSSNLKLDKYIACCVTYRGRVDPETAVNTVNKLKALRGFKMVDWCPTGFKTGITYRDPVRSTQSSEVGILINSTNFGRIFEREAFKFDQLYSKRAFCHWYIGDGLDEGAFSEARENLEYSIKEYEQMKEFSRGNNDE